MSGPQRIRHRADTVLDQIETRNRVWNPETLDWEVQTTEVQEHIDPTAHYKFSDNTASGDPQYFGYVDKDENWYVMKFTATGARFAKGSGNYAANFANCPNLTYSYFYELSW